MLVRLVKMTFREDAVETFRHFFEERKATIRGFAGCTHLELWQDADCSTTFFTCSRWLDEASLSHYRNSTFFRETWQETKQLFAAKAEAWSVDPVAVLP
jgi:hypothetical protein